MHASLEDIVTSSFPIFADKGINFLKKNWGRGGHISLDVSKKGGWNARL